jgi:hypothetical protein
MGRERYFVRDERAKAVLEYAHELARIGFESEVVYPEHYFWAMLIADKEHVKRLLSRAGGAALTSAERKTRAYATEPMRFPHAAKNAERESGMSEKLMELMQEASRLAGGMTDADELVVTPELIVAAAGTERVARDIVYRCWGLHPDRIYKYYREQGIPLPLTPAEEANVLFAAEQVPDDLSQLEIPEEPEQQ